MSDTPFPNQFLLNETNHQLQLCFKILYSAGSLLKQKELKLVTQFNCGLQKHELSSLQKHSERYWMGIPLNASGQFVVDET